MRTDKSTGSEHFCVFYFAETYDSLSDCPEIIISSNCQGFFKLYTAILLKKLNIFMMLAYVSVILICIGTYHLILYYRKRLRFMQAANALPGPKAYPIIGNAYYFFQTSFDDLLPCLYKLMDIYPSPFRLWMGNKLFIIISEPDQAKLISPLLVDSVVQTILLQLFNRSNALRLADNGTLPQTLCLGYNNTYT
ncbi:uncharacterized protein LOC112589102 [Harpegnathos saltator]|uniref:uncharacterized protein LOC112589102 n=1 Tax=Harpegnathos saltator TaxID=610380 RepID=UPI000DBEDD2C|nr:uncharacterized protein LOC112589102 [Harpegnathos saltator]